MSSLPNALTPASMIRCTSASTAASPTSAIARPPSAFTSAAVSSTSSRERAAQTTAAPSAANMRLITRPTPLLAPVTSATLPSSCRIDPPPSAKCLDELLERDHLTTPRRRRHPDQRTHAGREPGVDAVANLLEAAEQRHVPKPAIGHELRHALDLPARQRRADRQHLLFVAGFDPVVLIVRQPDVGRERAPHHRGRRRAVVVDARRHHVADEERVIVQRTLRQVPQRGRHVGTGAVGPDRALRDLAGQLDHAPAQGRQNNGRQRADLRSGRGHLVHELLDVVERLAGLEPQALVRGPVAHADPEPESSARQLVDDGRGLRVVEGMARVDVGDAGAERDLAGRLRERLAVRLAAGQADTRARTVEDRAAFQLETLGHVECRAPAHGDSDEAGGWFGAQLREYSRTHYGPRTQKEVISRRAIVSTRTRAASRT